MGNSKALTLTEMPSEELRPIPNHPGYFVTITGRIYSIKELTPRLHSDGYLRVSMYGRGGGKYRRRGIHQCMALAFIPNPENLPEVRHLDGNKLHNSIGNFRWGTRQDNARDIARHGTLAGENCWKAKLTAAQVLEIRARYKTPGWSRRTLAAKYGVSMPTIKAICNRRNWRHI